MNSVENKYSDPSPKSDKESDKTFSFDKMMKYFRYSEETAINPE